MSNIQAHPSNYAIAATKTQSSLFLPVHSGSMEYAPLNQSADEIRILTILPTSSRNDIQTTISHTPSSASDYEALSYCWGAPGFTKTISVNNHTVQVTANLFAALRQFSLDGTHVKLWVDALCINQADVEERSRQVLRMRDIYANAKQVVVWLGEEGECTNEGMRLLEVLGTVGSDVYEAERKVAYAGVGNGKSNHYQAAWTGLRELFDRPYWLRMWIIQEVVVAEKIKLQCGSRSVDWDQLRWAITRFSIMGAEARYSVFPRGDRRLLTVFQLIQHRQRRIDGQGITMLEALGLSTTSLSTDARDKIYALLGLATDGRSLVPVPDYNASFEIIIEKFMRSLILDIEDNNLLFLRAASSKRSLSLPSWIPDLVDVNWYFRETSLTNRWYNAGGAGTPVMKFPENNSVFEIRGQVFDTADGLATMAIDQPGQVVQSSRTINAYGSISKMRDAIWRSLFCNIQKARTLDPLPSKWGYCFSTLWSNGSPVTPSWLLPQQADTISSWLKQNHIFTIAGQSLSFWAEGSSEVRKQNFLSRMLGSKDSKSVNEGDKDFFRELAENVSSKRLIITARGYIGMVHPWTEKGNVIAVIPGFKMTVVLRPYGDMWKLVGEAYVHGIMDGEALENIDQRQMTDFLLC
ncbi:heterokaryon incompatibility protein-domain-containing protein [Halenospora varia]|nr:heterokaryon incompatibility protein-domain-containing protein [Halenospora varia]